MRLLFSPLTVCHCEYHESLVGMYLVLSLVPSPHVAEQAVHDPHGPTSQSTNKVMIFLDKFNHNIITSRADNIVTRVCFCQGKWNRPGLDAGGTLGAIV